MAKPKVKVSANGSKIAIEGEYGSFWNEDLLAIKALCPRSGVDQASVFCPNFKECVVPEIGIREDRQLRAGEIIDAAAASGAIPKCRNGKDFLLRHELMRDRSLMPQLKQVPGEEWFEGEGPPWK